MLDERGPNRHNGGTDSADLEREAHKRQAG